jgi:hypothetical protein
VSQESIERFKEIWSSWGLGRFPMGANVQEFISALEEEAGSSSDGSTLELRVVQCILLDAESVGAAGRPVWNEVTSCLGADWSMGEMKEVAFVQAMLIAVWPTAPALAALTVAGRTTQRGRENQKPQISAWLTSGQEVDHDRWAGMDAEETQSQMIGAAEQKLLWWGHSRYCSPLRCPYRAIQTDSIKTVWWAAVEVAALGALLEFAPLSAFLVNTLETLGLRVDDERPASVWLSSLAEVLRAVPHELREHVVPKEPLRSLAEKDALGLPVTWLRLGRSGELSSAVALDFERPIDLGGFAEWLLGELLLDHRMAQ